MCACRNWLTWALMNHNKCERTINLLEKPRLRATCACSLGLSHFLVAAGVLAFLEKSDVLLTLAGKLGVFALVLLVLLAFEFLLNGCLCVTLKNGRLALTPIARVLDWIISPISGTLVRLQGTDD